MCPTSGISYDEPQPNLFSFNSPYGACPKCNGLGMVSEVDINKIIPNKKLKDYFEKYKDYYLIDGLMYLSFILVLLFLFIFFS